MIKTKVKFLVNDQEDDVFAYFPEENYDLGNELKTSYAHIGQHSACHVDYAKECRVATSEEYKDLYIELTEIVGYNLEII